ncbi:MAG: hypothetical protein QM762_12755 [Chryseolinea sp.]
MAEVEKFIPRRINKDVSPETLNGTDRGFLPGDLVDAVNCRYFNHGANGVTKNPKGNISKTYAELPTVGINKVIGVLVNERDNTLIYFIWNEGGNHRIVEYTFDTEAFQTLLSGSSLNFDKDFYICQGGVIDDIVIYNDRKNAIQNFSLSRARAAGYTAPYNKQTLSLAVPVPMVPLTTSLEEDTAFKINRITGNTWQFTYRWVYKDKRKSAFAPPSKLVYPNTKATPGKTLNNTVRMYAYVPPELIPVVKAVEIVARLGNSGNYNVFRELSTWVASDPTLGNKFETTFNNSEGIIPVALAEQTKMYDAIPDVSEAVEVIENRVFTVLNKTGLEFDASLLNLTLSLENFVLSTHTLKPAPYIWNARDTFVKTGGVYNVGVVLFDTYGKPTYVKGSKQISIDLDFPDSGETARVVRQKIKFNLLASNIPSKFARYSIVISENQNHSTYFQCVPKYHFYYRDLVEGEGDNQNVGSDYYHWRGKKFYTYNYLSSALGGSMPTYKGKLYIQIPLNVPLLPDATCYVRFPKTFPERIYPIEAVYGDFMVISPSNDLITYIINAPADELDENVEVFQLKQSADELYFETQHTYPIVGGSISQQGVIDGDTYNLGPLDEVGLSNIDYQNSVGRYANNGHVYTPGYAGMPVAIDDYVVYRVESPSGILRNAPISRPTTVSIKQDWKTVSESQTTVNTIDYTKTALSLGRPHTLNSNDETLDLYTTFGFSDVYIQQTNVNGLNSFSATNQYPLAIERGRVRSAKKVGKVLLAIHERKASTLYIGQGFIRQGEGFIIAKTDSVVGDDRELGEELGTINPESVVEFNNQVFFWDAYTGCVVRYTNAGLYPISWNGMEQYFVAKGQQLFAYRDKIRVTIAHDRKYKELLVSFSDVLNDAGAVLVAGETWAFSLKDETWKQRFEYLPERAIGVNLSLFSFKAGNLWLHDANPVCNNFYGQQFTRRMRFVCNPFLGKNKRYLNIHIKGPIATDPTGETVVARYLTNEGQESFTPAYEFELDNGKNVAPVFKDINSVVETNQIALRSGEDLVSNYMEFEVMNDRTDEAPCAQINIIYKTEDFSV